MKKPTSIDVAKLAGVSQATVSFVLNNNPNIVISDETRKKVMDAVEKLNYIPRVKSSNYSKSTDNLLALFLPNMSNIYYPELAKSIEKHALAKGYKILIINTNRDLQNEKYYLDLMQKIKVAGIIYGFTPAFPNIVKAISLKIPAVVIGEAQDELNVDIVALDSFKAGEIMAQYLFKLGHKKIAFISGPLSDISLSRKKRLEGMKNYFFVKGLENNIITFSDDNEQEFNNANYEFEIGYSLCMKLLESTKVTAIVGANDMTAYGVLKALNERQIRVPQDISVCGFDNIFVPSIMPPQLTTIDHCIDQRCRLAIDLLDDKILGKTQVPIKVNYEPVLINRGSAAKI